jgi:SpoVK/Ycf46/Vps4 family AAA+-type ATPase
MLEKLQLLIRSQNALISLETRDEPFAVSLVHEAASKLAMPLNEWSVTTGLEQKIPIPQASGIGKGNAAQMLEHLLRNTKQREIYLLKDLGPHCKEPVVMRLLRDLQMKGHAHLVLLESTPLPPNIARWCVPISIPLPTAAELEKVVRDTYQQIRDHSYTEITSNLTKRQLEQLVQTLRGLTTCEAARVVAAAIYHDSALTAEDLPRIVEGKRNLLQSSGSLEAINVNVTIEEIGGLQGIKHWLLRRRNANTQQAREFGLESPRGMLLLGVQGCGKSLCAKAVAADWNLPLLRLDPGLLYQKFIGESENRLRATLEQAEAMAPAVLWIDEIEKAFASATAASADGGLSQRMFGTLLSWMQDHTSPLFLVATANNISALPPELMRKGRFDEVFFVDLPDLVARAEILKIHLERRKRKPKQFALEELAQAAAGFSGAEIEQAIIGALFSAFSQGEELTTEHVLAEMRGTRPLSVLMAEQVKELRAWAKHRCVPAG